MFLLRIKLISIPGKMKTCQRNLSKATKRMRCATAGRLSSLLSALVGDRTVRVSGSHKSVSLGWEWGVILSTALDKIKLLSRRQGVGKAASQAKI